MKTFFPKSVRHRVIKNPIAAPAAPAPAAPAMTVVKISPSLAGTIEAVAPLVCRQTVADAIAHLYLARSYAFTGDAPESFVKLGVFKSFALNGKLLAEMSNFATGGLVITNPLPNGFKIFGSPERIQIQLAGVDLVLPEVSDFDALADSMLMFCGGEIMSIATAEMTGKGIYTLTVLRGRFGTTVEQHRAGDILWIVDRQRLKCFSHPYCTAGNIAKFKIAIGKQPLTDVVPFEIKL